MQLDLFLPIDIDRRDYHLMLDVVLARECRQCGEVYFDEPEVDSIQEIIQAVEDRTKNLIVAA